ncbi:MAG: hypothetical protein AAGG44_02815 [Planctomycetota bacterium]
MLKLERLIVLTMPVWLGLVSPACSAEPFRLVATSESTKQHLRLLAGPDVAIDLLDTADETWLRRSLAERQRVYIFALRQEVDPIVAERLENMGHPVSFLNAPRPEQEASSLHIQLRALCSRLSRIIPSKAEEFRARLSEYEAVLRIRGRKRAIVRPMDYATTSEYESDSATKS